jgi:hypothetical protein
MSARRAVGGLQSPTARTAGSKATAALEAVCAALVAEPMWHVSLGSKELFHSNLLGWMCERFPRAAMAVFEPWLVRDAAATSTRVRREYKHLDLIVEFAGFAPLVIENKVFALPDDAQLARYASDALRRISGATPLLLSVTDPGWPGGRLRTGGYEWHHLSYGELATGLRAAFAGKAGFDAQLLVHEATLIEALVAVIDLIGKPDPAQPIALRSQQIEILDAARLSDGIGKIRARHIMDLIEAEYAERGLNPTRTEVGFSRGLTLLAAFWLGPDGDGVGWQFQGRQWRLAMIVATRRGVGTQRAAERAAFAAKHVRWFDFTPLYRTLHVTDEDVRPKNARVPADGFNKYDPDFVYRYRLLPQDATVSQFVELAVAYGKAAQAWRFTSAHSRRPQRPKRT